MNVKYSKRRIKTIFVQIIYSSGSIRFRQIIHKNENSGQNEQSLEYIFNPQETFNDIV